MATIQFADVLDHQLLPIDSQDVVTKVRLVIAGNVAGVAPWDVLHSQLIQDVDADPETGELPIEEFRYFPDPIVFEYEDPLHATYGVVKSFALPTGVNPFLPPEHPDIPEPFTDNLSNPGSPSAVRDGDPVTFASIITPDQSGAASIAYDWNADKRFVGWMAHVSGVREASSFGSMAGSPAHVTFTEHRIVNANVTAVRTWADYRVATGTGAEVESVFPGDARGNAANGADGRRWARLLFFMSVMQPPDYVQQPDVKIFSFYPLILNEDLLLDIAKAQVRLPAQTPRRVTVRGTLVPDSLEHTIVGWPGGDYTGKVARQSYREGTTVVDFEQAGAPPGVAQEAIEAERVRAARTRQVVETAGYALKMGERQ